jgi:hypothetical protein
VRGDHDVLGVELGLGHLQDDVDDTLSNVCRRAVHLRGAVGGQADARGAVVVEPL